MVALDWKELGTNPKTKDVFWSLSGCKTISTDYGFRSPRTCFFFDNRLTIPVQKRTLEKGKDFLEEIYTGGSCEIALNADFPALQIDRSVPTGEKIYNQLITARAVSFLFRELQEQGIEPLSHRNKIRLRGIPVGFGVTDFVELLKEAGLKIEKVVLPEHIADRNIEFRLINTGENKAVIRDLQKLCGHSLQKS